jgi:hypothetical protein
MDPTTEQQLVTKDYLKAELQQLRAELLEQLILNQRWNVGLIFGLYATSIATLVAIILK